MPVVGVKRDLLFEKLGKEYTEEEFDVLCFDYGIELDDVLSEKDMVRKELHKEGEEEAEASDDIIYKIDIPANRYDMLCLEGIARALNVFRRTIPSPRYTLADMTGKEMQQMVVKPETALVRPFVVCAILRGVALNSERYASFIDLQDKLHQNLCRHRTLVAIGTHDLATVQGPFSYEALPPEAVSFVPLKQTEEFRADRLLDYYLENDAKLKKYVPIIKGSVVYPVIYDAKRTVLSLPPVINGAHSAITTATRDVFIECTATDLTKANIVLNIMCTMFSEYCDKPFQVEPVEVVDALGNSACYPELSCRTMEVPVETVNRTIGVKLEGSHIAKLLSKMQLTSHLSGSGGSMVQVEVPPTRSDVLHACDIVEDVAIAYGYNNIQKTIPATVTEGRELPLNQLTELLRQECAMAGWTEILTWALVSKAEAFDMIRVEDDGTTAVEIGNPATAEFEVCRTKLLPSALKTLAANKSAALPLRLFEISDVIELDAEASTGARNRRHLVALTCSKESGFEVIHGLLNRVMDVLGVPIAGSNPDLERRFLGGYEWQECSLPTFFPGRQAKVLLNAREVGTFGVVHPQVLANFDIGFPVSALELNIEPFCFDQSYQTLTTQFHD